MIYDPVAGTTRFVSGTGDAWGYEESILATPTERLVPYSATNNLVKHNVVLFPSEPAEYGDEAALVSSIKAFLRRYVDVSEDFELLSIYYILFSWVYDAFHETPYLRVRGGYGSGKTRYLLTMGSLCRFPLFASAASTVSPIFRLLDSFRGTLILDESDFRQSDEKAEIVKILNNGNTKGFPILRTEVSSSREYNPRAYHVFGPKVIASRGVFEDQALESRCITEDMHAGSLRRDIPLNLDEHFHEEAREIRNQLLLYRLRRFKDAPGNIRTNTENLEPRLQQIFGPLVSVIQDASDKEKVVALIAKYHEAMVDERSDTTEAQILTVIHDLVAKGPGERVAIQDITREFMARHGEAYERRITPRWIGSLVRHRLGLRPSRSSGIFTLGPEDVARLASLYARYGVEVPPGNQTPDVERDATPTAVP
ncbi:MAG TPA: hypothetical protein VGQ76_15425 [Thermoanaerobaculia bacterium]|jgi:hypothetical protein|nr:hypothetical protein [Thermoanaerobaculia bacterium]